MRSTGEAAAVEEQLPNGRPGLVLEPIVDLFRGRWFGFEALRHATATPDLPFDVEVALAIRALDLLQALPTAMSVSVNISPETLASGEFATAIRTYPHERIIIEISERAECGAPDALAEQAELLQFRGVRIAIDNVSGGSSHIQRFLRLGPDFMKLDRSLVAGIATDPARQSLIVSLQQLAMEKRIELVAESIDTSADFNMLLGLGVRLGQGRIPGRPVQPVAALARVSLMRHAGIA